MNNLNSNVANSNNNTTFAVNNKGSTRKYKGDYGNLVLICLIAFLLLILIFLGIIVSIYVKTYNQNKIQNHIEEELLKYIHDCKDNFKAIPGTKIPSSTLANEYSLNFWIYVNNLEYRNDFNKQILMKGNPNNYNVNKENYPQSNPNIYIEKETNDMVLLFEGETNFTDDSIGGCYRLFDLFNIIETKIKHGEEYLKKNGTDIGQTSTIGEGSLFTIEFRANEEVSGEIIKFFRIKVGDNYLKADANNTTILFGTQNDATDFEIAKSEIGKFILKAHIGDSIQRTLRYLKYNTTDSKYELSTGGDKFTFEIQNYGQNGLDITSDRKTGEECKRDTITAGESYTHYGMVRNEALMGDNVDRNGLCKPLTRSRFDNNVRNVAEEYCGQDDYAKLGSRNHMYVRSVSGQSAGKVIIKNIPIQRWTCFNVSVHNNVVDIYKDGLLYHTEILDNPPKINDDAIILANNGGFDGYLSRITWSNKALHPGDIYNKYKEGPRITKTLGDRIMGMFGSSESKE